MKKLFLIAIAALSALACLSVPPSHALNANTGRLVDDGSTAIQAFVPDPAKSQVPINLNGTKVFKKGSGGDYNITGWTAINIVPSTANLTRYFNSDTTKTRTITAGIDNIIVIHPGVTQITISGTDTRVEIEGM